MQNEKLKQPKGKRDDFYLQWPYSQLTIHHSQKGNGDVFDFYKIPCACQIR